MYPARSKEFMQRGWTGFKIDWRHAECCERVRKTKIIYNLYFFVFGLDSDSDSDTDSDSFAK